MKFSEEYRKANNAISAPKTLLDSIRSEAEPDGAPSLVASFDRPKRVWPRVLGYSGAAVAVAALTLLVVRPFGLFERANSSSTSMQMVAESKSYDMAAEDAPAMTEGMMLLTETTAEDAPRAALGASITGEGDSEIDDYYYEEYLLPDPTYADIWAALAPTERPAEDTGDWTKAPIVDSGAENDLPDLALPDGYALCAAIRSDGRLFVIEDADGDTVLLVCDEEQNILGQVTAPGIFRSYELRDTTLFSDEGSLETHRALLLETEWSPDLSAAVEDDPASYCPSVTDASGTRVLSPDEITVIDAGDRYAVYTAVAWDEGVRILYAFAELGLG